MTAPNQPPVDYAKDGKRGFPIGIAVLVILLFLGGGGYMLWSAWNGGSVFGSGAVVGAADPPSNHPRNEVMRIQRQAEFQAAQLNQPDGFRRNNQNADPELKAGPYRMTFAKKANGDPRLILLPVRIDDFITPDQRQILSLRGRVMNDKAVAAYIKATPEQMTQLKKISGGNGGMLIDPADEKNVVDTYKTYQSAQGSAKTDAEKQLVTMVRDIATRSAEPTKKSVADRVTAILAVFSADQVDAFKKM